MQKNAAESDLRVRRTKLLLQKALLELTIEQGFANISVQDITARAMVNRSTFYRHYLDKYDLLKQYGEEVFALTQTWEAAETAKWDENAAGKAGQAPLGLVRLLEHVSANAAFYRAMLGKNGDPSFARQMSQYIEKRFRQMIPANIVVKDQNQPPLELTLSYVSWAGVGTLIWWLENGLLYSPTEMADWLTRFSSADLALLG